MPQDFEVSACRLSFMLDGVPVTVHGPTIDECASDARKIMAGSAGQNIAANRDREQTPESRGVDTGAGMPPNPAAPYEVPHEITAAARLVSRWFAERNIAGWRLDGCADRDSVALRIPIAGEAS